jgi:hypothetical protein
MENCSSANNDPRTSGGLISAGKRAVCGVDHLHKCLKQRKQGKAIVQYLPERANDNAADNPSGRELRQRACPRLQC